MFGDPFLIRLFPNFLKLFDNLRKFLLTDISDGITFLFYFGDLTLVLKARAVTKPFPDFSNFILTMKMRFPSCSDCQTLMIRPR